ncbi:cation diffusion facilitator family transporter [Aestuariivirga sp.]|uniref:cation diffusion facilitator family transporter n=1 Tax=Aestuariivirga sp. TaxID=2650926 RepID=UPI0035941B9A
MAHDHTHAAPVNGDIGIAFKWAVILNVAYVLVETISGFAIGSLALLADAAHNLTDVAGLLIAWGAAVMSRRPPSELFTYGLGRSTIMAALANAAAILVGVGAVVWEAVQRFSEPVTIQAAPVLVVALIGIAVNAGTALLFRKERQHDLNAEGAFLHMAADAAVSAGVVLAAFGMLITGWAWLDPLAAILVSLVIGWSSFGLLKTALGLSLDGVPHSVDRKAVEAWLGQRRGVSSFHDVHIWSLSTTKIAMTAHLVMPGGHPGDGFLEETAEELEHHFGIAHVTLQVETGDGNICRLAPANTV